MGPHRYMQEGGTLSPVAIIPDKLLLSDSWSILTRPRVEPFQVATWDQDHENR